MPNFTGTFDCRLDAKGRMMIPIGLKDQLGQAEQRFVLKRSVFQNCLELYPMSEWSVLMEKMNALNRFVKKNADFIRQFTAGVATVEVDAVGRLLIPKSLLEFSGIDKDVVLASAINIIEVWNKAKYEAAVDASTSDFSKLAEEVMGNFGKDVS